MDVERRGGWHANDDGNIKVGWANKSDGYVSGGLNTLCTCYIHCDKLSQTRSKLSKNRIKVLLIVDLKG